MIWTSPDGNIASQDYVVLNCIPGIYVLDIAEDGAEDCPLYHVTVYSETCPTTGSLTSGFVTSEGMTSGQISIATSGFITSGPTSQFITMTTGESSKESSNESNRSTGAAIGVGVTALLILMGSAVFLIIRAKRRRVNEPEVKLESNIEMQDRIPAIDSITIQKKLGEGMTT